MSSVETPLILSLETATRAGSTSVLHGESALAVRAGDAKVSHSTHLLENIKSVLDEAGVTLQDVSLFAVASGPGSFTGLRIGLATVKSFATTLNRPCVGIPTLHAIARGAGESRCTIAMLPAGRGEVYAQRLMVSESGEVKPLETPKHITPQRLIASVASAQPLKWAGEGALLHAEAIRAYALSNGIEVLLSDGRGENADERDQWVLSSITEPLSVSVARLALMRLREGEAALQQDLRAIYVRPSDAELNERCQE